MKYILTLLAGLIIGGALIYFFLVGAPRANKPPGEIVTAPDAGGDPPGTVVLALDEQFFNTLLGTVFRDMGSPTFKLAGAKREAAPSASDAAAFSVVATPTTLDSFDFIKVQEGGCASQVVVAAEGSGVKTGVRLADGQIAAPLAFSGSYNTFGQCLSFRGWAQANIQLRFEQSEQTLYGQINVESVNLEGISPLFGGLVTGFVQNAINQRVNPLILMRGSQIGLQIPVQATGGTLRAQARQIRSEVKDGVLRLHITYDFQGAGGQPSQAQPPA
ncbi:MAG TPA: hypothetical protein VGB73_06965 [Pyrinomonadaceae bacterium]|jgi:hypothetical protein